MRYFLYARKSEEDKSRQVASINDQIKELTALASLRGLTVVREYTEERTARKPGRPVFNEMLSAIGRGEAEGILVWSISRLLRNPVDQGSVQWLLQQRVIRSVMTMDREHTSDDNVLILNVESGVANQFIIDLQKATVRGLRSKVEQGWFPHRAPEGYVNDSSKPQGQRDIVPDAERYPLLRSAWELMMAGESSVQQVRDFLLRAGYTPKPHKKNSKGELSRNALYRIFTNRFYTGSFTCNGEWIRGKHVPMVTEAEFDEVQMVLGRRSRIGVQKRTFAYGSGLMTCGRCGCQIVGELHRRPTKVGGIRLHTYYCCTNARRICDRRTIKEDYIDEQIRMHYSRISIDPSCRRLLMDMWRRHLELRQSQEEVMTKSRRSAAAAKRTERDRLLDLRLQNLIDDEMFKAKKLELDKTIFELNVDEGNCVTDGGKGMLADRQAEDALIFMTEPKDRIYALGAKEKRAVARSLATRYILIGRKLTVELRPELRPFVSASKPLEVSCLRFERTKYRSETHKQEAFDNLYRIWGRIFERMRKVAFESLEGAIPESSCDGEPPSFPVPRATVSPLR